jgi:hypothetical protein
MVKTMKNLFKAAYILAEPIAAAERSGARTVFDRSQAVIAGSNPALGMDV